MIKKLEKIDEILCHYENFLHGKDGEDCTEARKLIREAIEEAKNISLNLPVIGAVCDCKDRSTFYRDKECNDICYDCDLPIANCN